MSRVVRAAAIDPRHLRARTDVHLRGSEREIVHAHDGRSDRFRRQLNVAGRYNGGGGRALRHARPERHDDADAREDGDDADGPYTCGAHRAPPPTTTVPFMNGCGI